MGAEQVSGSCACCAHALSIEAADDNDLVTLRCAVHHRDVVLALSDARFPAELDAWFATHALCTRVGVAAAA